MKENGLVEFRWHGRGGQGAKTACLLLADAAFSSGKFVQGFPEYGPERMGAPITAYNRISDTRCSIHCNIDCPDYVVVVDETLLDTVDVTKGLSPTGAVIVNTARGGIINEEALYEALKSGSIRGAGLDATVDEPPYDSPLMTLPNCILTPHAGAATKEASSKMSLMAAQNVVDVLTTGDCKYKVNP